MSSRQPLLPFFILLGVGIALLALVGQLIPRAPEGSEPALRVVTTTPLFADFVRRVGGDRVRVTTLLPAGADPHSFEPTPREVSAVAEADILFYNGYNFEVWLNRVLENVAAPGLRRVQLPEGLEPLPLGVAGPGGLDPGSHDEDDDHEHLHGPYDPHFWLDVTHAMHYVQRIADALSEADPAGAEEYAARAGEYLAELDELDRWIHEQIAAIPPERRMLVTYHDAFGYFARRYGLQVVGSLVTDPDVEPSAQAMAALVDTIRELGVPAVFVDASVNPRLVESLAHDAGVATGILYSDTLTDAYPSYVQLMQANVHALVEGLSRR